MIDLDETVKSVIDERSHGVLQALPASVASFPELSSEEATEPMDYELSHVPADVAPGERSCLCLCSEHVTIPFTLTYVLSLPVLVPLVLTMDSRLLIADGVRAFIVVDTNVLITHLDFTQKALERLTGPGADHQRVEAALLVPWVVLNELDKLKDGEKRAQADVARRALRRLRALTAERDGYVHCQTAAEHAAAVAGVVLPDLGARRLRGDDMILQSCLHYDASYAAAYRRAGHRAGVFLLSNDAGLCVRAAANGVRCFTAQEFPVEPDLLAKVR
jgi:rRNA-processing protein FCF1